MYKINLLILYLDKTDSYVGIIYLILMKASSPPVNSNFSRVSSIKSPIFSLFC